MRTIAAPNAIAVSDRWQRQSEGAHVNPEEQISGMSKLPGLLNLMSPDARILLGSELARDAFISREEYMQYLCGYALAEIKSSEEMRPTFERLRGELSEEEQAILTNVILSRMLNDT